jgi:hypothetical protein
MSITAACAASEIWFSQHWKASFLAQSRPLANTFRTRFRGGTPGMEANVIGAEFL